MDLHRFRYLGDGIGGFDGALGRAERAGKDFRYLRPTHEEMASLMARAHGKFTGGVGAYTATSGPGAAGGGRQAGGGDHHRTAGQGGGAGRRPPPHPAAGPARIQAQLRERVLLPAVRALEPDEHIVTNGFSCREESVAAGNVVRRR